VTPVVAAVADLDHDVAVALGGGDGGDGPGGGVGAHVGEQVVDGPAQQLLVAGGHEAGGDLRPPRPPRISDLGPFGTSPHQGGEIDHVVLLVGVLVEPGQPEHVVDQPAHPLGLQRDAAHRLVDLRTPGEGALLVELGVGAQRRQWRSGARICWRPG
jgi:hypothetical protein